MGTYPLTNVTHLLCLSSHEYQHVFRRVGTNITVGAVGNQPSYQLDNPKLLLERHCTFSKLSSTFWVSLCNCNKWLKLQIIPYTSLSPPTHHIPYCFSHSTQPEKCVHASLPNSHRDNESDAISHTGQKQWKSSTSISETTRPIKPCLHLAVQTSLHSPPAKQGSLQPLYFFNTFSNGLQTWSLWLLVMYKQSQLSTFQIHKNTFLRAYSFVLHSSNEKVGWGTNNVNGMVQLSFLIG